MKNILLFITLINHSVLLPLQAMVPPCSDIRFGGVGSGIVNEFSSS